MMVLSLNFPDPPKRLAFPHLLTKVEGALVIVQPEKFEGS